MEAINRLQFLHSDYLFQSAEDVRKYVNVIMKEYPTQGYEPLYGEPIVFKYGTDEANPNIILAIGSHTRNAEDEADRAEVFFIDTADMEASMAELQTIVEDNQEAVENVNDILANLLNACGAKEDGTIEGLTTSLKDAILTLASKVNTLEDKEVVSGSYDKTKESIVLKEKSGAEVEIKVSSLINEWTVEKNSKTPVQLKKERVVYSELEEDWQDVLTADVKIDNDNPFNILKKTTNGDKLYVEGRASAIACLNPSGTQSNLQSELARLNETANISTHNGNILSKKGDGLFAYVDVDYVEGENTLVLTTTTQDGTTSSKQIPLNAISFEEGYYDKVSECLVVEYTDSFGHLKKMVIPAKELLSELTVLNGTTNVTLHYQRNTGSTGDILSAEVNISPVSGNILENIGTQLYVKGTADNIKYDAENTVEEKIQALEELIEEGSGSSSSLILLEKERAMEAEALLTEKINATNASANTLSQAVDENAENIEQLMDIVTGTFNSSLNLDEAHNMLIFKDNEGVEKKLQLNTIKIIKKVQYDSTNDELVVTYMDSTGSLRDERIMATNFYEGSLSQDSATVKITIGKDTTTKQDIISADVKIVDSDSNLLEKTDDGLYASNHADKLIASYNDERVTVQKAINNLKQGLEAEVQTRANADTALNTKIDNAIEAEEIRATSAEEELERKITDIDERATAFECSTTELLENLQNTVTENETSIQDLKDEDTKIWNFVATNSRSISDANMRIDDIESDVQSVSATVLNIKNAKLNYEPALNTLIFTDNKGVESIYQLNTTSIIRKITYNDVNDEIEISYQKIDGSIEVIAIPAKDFFEEVKGIDSNTIKMDTSKNIVSATVKVDYADNNALKATNDGLFVSNHADSIYTSYQDVKITVQDAISTIRTNLAQTIETVDEHTTKISNLQNDVEYAIDIINLEVTRATNAESAIRDEIAEHTSEEDAKINYISGVVSTLQTEVGTMQSDIAEVKDSLTKIWAMLETIYNKSTFATTSDSDVTFQTSYTGGTFNELKDNTTASSATTQVKADLTADLNT